MSTSTTTTTSVPRRKRARAAIALLGVLAVGGVGASALWSDTAQVETEVTSGSLNINIDGDEGNPVPYALDLGLDNVVPGQTTEHSVTINNTGTVPVLVTMTSTAEKGTTGLANEMRAGYRSGQAITSLPLRTFRIPMPGKSAPIIAPGASEKFDFIVIAPPELSPGLQGTDDTVTMTFVANQVG